jgi:hypothetical protein
MECAGRAGAATALSGGRSWLNEQTVLCGRKRCRAALATAVQDTPAPAGRQLCRNRNGNEFQLRQERNMSPRRARELGGAGGYKDFAPDCAFGRSATVSTGPVAAGGGAEVVENIWRRRFANVLRLIPLCGTQPRSYRNAVAAFSPALTDAMEAVRKHLRWVNGRNEINSDLNGLGNRERNLAKPKARRAERAGASESTSCVTVAAMEWMQTI